MTGKEWARQEYLTMLGLSVQSRNIAEENAQAAEDAKETETGE